MPTPSVIQISIPGKQGPIGLTGLQGVVFRGTWSAGTYVHRDVVWHEDTSSLWYCNVTSTTGVPGVSGDWIVFVDAEGAIDAIDAAETAALSAITGQQTTSVNAVVSQQTTSVAAVVTQQATSIAAVAAAVVGTSTTSVAIGTGAKSFTTQTGKPFAVGQRLRIANDGTNWMEGAVSAYNSGTGALDVTVDLVGGAGTFAAWNIVTAGVRGATGAQGDVTFAQLNGAITSHVGLRNIFNQVDVAVGLLKNGVTVDAGATWRYTNGYLPVIPNGTVTFSQTITAAASYGVQWYTSALAYISTGAVPTANTPIAVPSNAAYMRFTLRDTQLATMVVVQGSTLPAEYIPFGILAPSARHTQITQIVRSFQRSDINLFVPSMRTTGTQVDATTGLTNTALGNNNVSDFIPVNGLSQVTMGLASHAVVISPHGIAFYDASRVFISGVAAPWTAGQVISVPAGAYFMRFTLHNTQVATFQVLRGSVTVGPYIGTQPAFVSDSRPWFGKNLGLQGDSLSSGEYDWMTPTFAYHGITLAKNFARFGRMWDKAMYNSDNTTLLQSSDFDNLDGFLIYLGTNDGPNPVGTPSDAAGAATVCGRAKQLIEQVLTWRPNQTRIMLATPHGRVLYGFPVFRAMSEQLRGVAKLYQIPVLDFNLEGGLNEFNAATSLPDGTHPNAAGLTAHWVRPAQAFFHRVFPMT